MTDTPNADSSTSGVSGVVPTAAEALARLDMSLLEAMMTQRAVRRVLPHPVDDAVVLKCIELALRAPTGANGQNWEFIVVKDRRVKEKLAGATAKPGSLLRRGHPARRCPGRVDGKDARAVQWQIDHFTEIPVLVVACLRVGAREGRVPYVPMPQAVASGYFGSIYPSVQNLLLAARAMRLGASPYHFAAVERGFGAQNPQSATFGNAVLHRATRLAARSLRTDDPQTGRAGGAPGYLWQPGLAPTRRRSHSLSGRSTVLPRLP